MQMPTATDDHRKLHRLAGTWIGEERLEPSPWGPGGPATGRLSGRVALDGMFVVADYTEEKEGKVVYGGHSVFGWDGQSKTVAWYWFDSMGDSPQEPARGTWDGDTLVLKSTSPRAQGRYTYRFHGNDRYEFRLENSFDGGKSWVKFMEGTYRRTAGASSP